MQTNQNRTVWVKFEMLRVGRLTIKDLIEEIEDHLHSTGRQRLLGLRAFNSTTDQAGAFLYPRDLVEDAITIGISAIHAELVGSDESSESEGEAIH